MRIRKSQGLVRRMTPFERFRSDERLFEVLKQELETGSVEGYGRGLLYTHFRTNGHLVTQLAFLVINMILDYHMIILVTNSVPLFLSERNFKTPRYFEPYVFRVIH